MKSEQSTATRSIRARVQKTNNKEQTFMIVQQITTSPMEKFAPTRSIFSVCGGATLLKASPLQSLSISTPRKGRYVRKARKRLQSTLLSE
jgi:hypothetical protein